MTPATTGATTGTTGTAVPPGGPTTPPVLTDGLGSFALANLTAHIPGPLAAGAVLTDVPLDGAGSARVGWRREPLLLVRLAAELGRESLVVSATIGPGSGQPTPAPATVTLTFDAFSEAGACLPLWPMGTLAVGLDDALVVLTARRLDDSGATGLPAHRVAGLLGLQLVQGTAGRLAFLLSAHKAAVRRAAREVASCRELARARSGSLDRHGRDLGVARFGDRLVGAATPTPQISTAPRLEPDGREADAAYRRRLAAMRTLTVPTRAGVLGAINGTGAPGDPPAGWLADLGGEHRIDVVERTNPFAVATLLVESGPGGDRANFLAALRRDRLVRAIAGPAVAADEATRLLTPQQREELDHLRAELAAGYRLAGAAADDPALAEGLARALAALAGLRRELGDASSWPLTRAQDPGGGSRYELGLGCDLALPAADDAEALRQAALAWAPAAETPPALAGMLAAAAGRAAGGADPLLGWLFGACGLRTVEPLPGGAVFVSCLPMYGLEVTGPPSIGAPGWNHLLPRASAPGLLLRHDRSQPVLQLAQVTSTQVLVVAATVEVPPLDELVQVDARDGGDDPGLLVGYDRTAGRIHVLRQVAGTFTVVASSDGWGHGWTHVVAGDLGGATAYRDVLLYDRRSGAVAVYGLQADGSLVASAATAGGALAAGALPRLGFWTRLVTVPGGDGGPDRLLCYDRERGDVQLAAASADGLLRVLWARAGWRPGFTDLVAPAAGAAGAALLAHDRESGDVATYLDVDTGGLTTMATARLPARSLTHLVPLGTGTAGTRDVLAYDRAGGRAAVWHVDVALPPPQEAPPSTGAVVPSQPWGTTTSAVVSASWRAAQDPAGGQHAALADGLARAAAGWASRGGEPWVVVADRTGQEAIWGSATDPGLVETVLSGVGLPMAAPDLVTETAGLPDDFVATLLLPAALSDQWRQGDGARQAQALVDVLAVSGLASAVGLVDSSGHVAVIVSVSALPGAGLNLSGRAAVGYRWYSLPVRGLPGVVRTLGPATVYRPAGEGLVAVVTLGYARAGLADPYEVVLDLPDTTALSLEQYEFLLNVVERAVPAGIQVNTLGLRRRHLDLDGDGTADPLPAVSTHVYRRFRRRSSTEPPSSS